MPTCPECGSTDVYEDPCSPEEKYDGLGNTLVIHYYTCNDCGCEWESRIEINRTVEVTKHGKEWKDLRAGTIELGNSKCSECNGEKRVLLIKQGEVWSHCKNCGSMLKEYGPGDEPEILVRLANQYHVSYAEIVEALENAGRK